MNTTFLFASYVNSRRTVTTGNPIRQHVRKFARYSTTLEKYTDYRLYSVGHLGEIYLRSVSADDIKRVPIFDPLVLELKVAIQPSAVEHTVSLRVHEETIFVSTFHLQQPWDIYSLRESLSDLVDEYIEDRQDANAEDSCEIDKDKALGIEEPFTLCIQHDYIEVENGTLRYIAFEVEYPKPAVLVCETPDHILFTELAYVLDSSNYNNSSSKGVKRKILTFINQLLWDRLEVVIEVFSEYDKSNGDRLRVDETFTARARTELCIFYETAVAPRLEEVDTASQAFILLKLLHQCRDMSMADLIGEFKKMKIQDAESRLFTSLTFATEALSSFKWRSGKKGSNQIWSWLVGFHKLLREDMLTDIIVKHTVMNRAIVKNSIVEDVISWHLLDKKQGLTCEIHPNKVVWSGASPGELLMPEHFKVDESRCTGVEGTVLTLVEEHNTDHMMHYWVDFAEIQKSGRLSSLLLIKDYMDFLVSFYAGSYQRQIVILSQVDNKYNIHVQEISHDDANKASLKNVCNCELGEALGIQDITTVAIKKEAQQMEDQTSSERNYYTLPTDFIAHPTAHGVCCHFLDYITSDKVVSHYFGLCVSEDRKLRPVWSEKYEYNCKSLSLSSKEALTISQWFKRGVHYFHIMSVDLNYRLYAIYRGRAQVKVDWNNHSRLKRSLTLYGEDTFSNSEVDLQARYFYVAYSNNLNSNDHPQPIVSFRLKI